MAMPVRSALLVTLFAAAAAAAAAGNGLSFITIGDWGGAALEEPSKPYAQNVKAVAAAMATSAKANDVKFIVNTGDNFYWCGIQNTSDFQVAKDWIDTYSAASLQVPWLGVLGNHEYGYNVQAQVDLSKIHKNWVMDDRYYSRRMQLGSSSSYATFVFLDSSPCINEYRASSSSGWDPCGTEYPTCSMSGGHDTFEGTCKFNQNILSQDCGKQFQWFKKTLAAIPKDDWVIVVAHHPADDIDTEDFTTALQNHGFDIYLNGHTHCLTHYQVDNKGAYVTSGAGALVMSHDQLGGTPAKDRTYNKVNAVNFEEMAKVNYGVNASAGKLGHSFQPVFTATKSGFTLHTFDADFKTLTTKFMDTSGNVLHSFTVTKGASPSPPPPPAPGSNTCKKFGCVYKYGNPCQCDKTCAKYNNCCSDYQSTCGAGPSPPPSPSPTPPSPSGQCCFYHATTCAHGDICCSSSGKGYTTAKSCAEYGAPHNCKWEDEKCVVP